MPRNGQSRAAYACYPGRSMEIELRIEDINMEGHVGNTSMLQIIDECRSRFLGFTAPGRPGQGTGLMGGLGATVRKVVAQQTVEYCSEVFYTHSPVTARMWISHIGTKSFSVATLIYAGTNDPAVVAEATYVLLDMSDSRPFPMDSVIRDRLLPFLSQPPQLRSRPSAAADSSKSPAPLKSQRTNSAHFMSPPEAQAVPETSWRERYSLPGFTQHFDLHP